MHSNVEDANRFVDRDFSVAASHLDHREKLTTDKLRREALMNR